MLREGYLTANGTGIQNCWTASMFRLSDAYILSAGDNGEIFSTSQGTVFAPLVASRNIRDTYALWEVTDGVLRWDNALFLNGSASFCISSSSTIMAYFLAPPPANCTSLVFDIAPGRFTYFLMITANCRFQCRLV